MILMKNKYKLTRALKQKNSKIGKNSQIMTKSLDMSGFC